MLQTNKDLFESFAVVHEKYSRDQEANRNEYNRLGARVLEAIQEWENKLCSQSEKGGYSSFTPKLAEKFRNEVRRHFPLIDHIGIIPEPAFTINKINI